MRFLFVGLLLTASTALGQTVTFSGSVISDNQIVVSRDNCTTNRSVTWTRAGNFCDSIFLWVSGTDEACSGEPGADDLLLNTLSATDTSTTGTTKAFSASQVLARSSTTCEAQTTEKRFRICATTKKANSNGTSGCESTATSVGTPVITFILDPEPPQVPSVPTATGLDGALSVRVTPPSDATTMRVQVQALGAGGDADAGTDPGGGVAPVGDAILSAEQATDNPVFRVEGLQNGVTYEVRALAIDRAGNSSGLSEAAQGTPIASSGFFGAYVGAGGDETGGCGAAGGSIAGGAALAILGMWLSRRKQS